MNTMQSHIDTFLTALATSLTLDPSSLKLVAVRQNGGPTVGPGSDSATGKQIAKGEAFIGKGAEKIPSLWYDSLGDDHVDFQISSMAKGTKVSVSKFIYGWQHHRMPGNCRICVNRWVRFGDPKAAANMDLVKAGLVLRAAFARHMASTKTMLITTGASFSGAEDFASFKELYGNSTHKVLALDLSSFKGI